MALLHNMRQHQRERPRNPIEFPVVFRDVALQAGSLLVLSVSMLTALSLTDHVRFLPATLALIFMTALGGVAWWPLVKWCDRDVTMRRPLSRPLRRGSLGLLLGLVALTVSAIVLALTEVQGPGKYYLGLAFVLGVVAGHRLMKLLVQVVLEYVVPGTYVVAVRTVEPPTEPQA